MSSARLPVKNYEEVVEIITTGNCRGEHKSLSREAHRREKHGTV